MLTGILGFYLRPYRGLTIAAIFLLLIQAMANLFLPHLNADLINNGVAKGDVNHIWHVGLLMLVASAISIAVSIVIAYLASRISMGFGRDLRSGLFKHVESFSSQEMGKFGPATLITRNTNDVLQVQMLVFMGLSMMIAAPITAIGAIIMAVNTNARLSLLLLVAVPLMAIIITLLLRQIVPLFRLNQIKIDRINLILREQIAGVRVIRAFVKGQEEESRFATASADLMETALKVTRTFALMFPLLMFILNGSTVAVIWFGAKLVDSDQIQVGSLTAFISYLMQILANVMMGVMMALMIPRAEASAERIQEIFNTKTSIAELPGTKAIEKASGIVEFKAVDFRYPGAEHSVLSDISFTAEPGKFTAIIGGTGSGKSTLLNLIPRFMEATGGAIFINGKDVREQNLEALWSTIGLVPQRSLLFRGSVRDNLKFGRPNATEVEMWEALRVAQARDFIEALPEKLDSQVAQGGTNFSGGQRQRLAIARAVIRKPKIYLLDDSFSALDYSTDAKLQNELHTFAKDSTLIVVAQRVSTILTADKIVVLDEGRIVGIGDHHSLMASCETYREIVLSQLDPEEAA